MIREYKTVLDSKTRLCQLREVAWYETPDERLQTTDPEAVVEMLNGIFELDCQSEEYVYLICLDMGNQVNGVFELSHGTVGNAPCQPREVFQKALLANAVSIIIAHNHTSGSVVPSKFDDEIFDRLNESGKILGIPLVDFIIVGNKNFMSFCKVGRIKS